MGREGAASSGEREYGDLLELLEESGLPASFVVDGTGGAGVEVQLDGGQVLLVTEVDGPLPPRRQDHRSWGVSLYPRSRAAGAAGAAAADEDPVAWDGTEDDGSLAALLPLVSGVLLDTMRGPSAEL